MDNVPPPWVETGVNKWAGRVSLTTSARDSSNRGVKMAATAAACCRSHLHNASAGSSSMLAAAAAATVIVIVHVGCSCSCSHWHQQVQLGSYSCSYCHHHSRWQTLIDAILVTMIRKKIIFTVHLVCPHCRLLSLLYHYVAQRMVVVV